MILAARAKLLVESEREMQEHRGINLFCLAVSLLTVMVITGLMLSATAATNQVNEFTGQVLSASGALVVGGEPTNPGHPVAGATVHLVPITAIDITTQMTASAIYAPPYPAEVYDEPPEDAIRLRGTEFPQSTTDSQGKFVIANVPNGKFFIHVTPDAEDTEHLPGGGQSRNSYSAEQLRGESMTIKISSSPSPAANAVGSSTCIACHQDKRVKPIPSWNSPRLLMAYAAFFFDVVVSIFSSRLNASRSLGRCR